MTRAKEKTTAEMLREVQRKMTLRPWRAVLHKKSARITNGEVQVHRIVDDFGAVTECIERWHADARGIVLAVNILEEVAALEDEASAILPILEKAIGGKSELRRVLDALDAKVRKELGVE